MMSVRVWAFGSAMLLLMSGHLLLMAVAALVPVAAYLLTSAVRQEREEARRLREGVPSAAGAPATL